MMNNYPHDCGNAGLVQKFIGTAYQTVKFVADNMHYIKTIYDMLTQYNMLACVESVEQLKNIDAKQVRFARIYALDDLEKRYVDYAFIDNDESGIKPNGIQYSGSWIKVGTSSAGTGGEGSRDIAWVYNNGSAQGGEETIIVPEQTAAVTCIYVNGNYQYPRLGFEYDELSQTIRLAQPLEEGDTVIVMLSGLPADPETPNIDNFKYFNWVYNNGKANGGEQTFRPPYNFKTVVAVFINGLRKEPQYHFTWNSEGLVQLREPVKENDFVVIQIGGDVHSLLLPNVMSGYTFKGGATLRTINDHIYDSVSKKWYQWIGTYPKRINENTVAADQINADGGVWSTKNPLGLWINASDTSLRSELGVIIKRYNSVYEMLSDTTEIGKLYSTGGTTWKMVSKSDPVVIGDFEPVGYVHSKDFGLGSDYPSSEKDKLSLIIESSNSGVILEDNITFSLGEIQANSYGILIDKPGGFHMTGRGVTIEANAQPQVEAVGPSCLMMIKNPKNVKISSGITFTDPLWVLEDSIGGTAFRYGWYAVGLYATAPYSEENPCGNVELCHSVFNTLGHTYSIGTNGVQDMGVTETIQRQAISDVNVRGVCKQAYYGMVNIVSAKKVFNGLSCVNVRRGHSCYGQQDFTIDIDLVCTEQFRGSNAFINLACEGDKPHQLVNSGDIRLKVSGVESHGTYVSFYHQGPLVDGIISNIDASIKFLNFTQTGKYDESSQSHAYAFRSETDSKPNHTTQRKINNIKMEIYQDESSSISGQPFITYSDPDFNNYRGKICFGPFMSKMDINKFRWTQFKVVESSFETAFTPVIFGSASAGSGTYTEQTGYLSINDNVQTVIVVVEWSNHTGKGQLRISGIPIAFANFNDISTPFVGISAYGFPESNSIQCIIAGDRKNFYINKVDQNGVLSALDVPSSGKIRITVTAPIN